MGSSDELTRSAAGRRVEAVWRRARGGERRPLTGHDRTLDRIALGALGISPGELREVLPRFEAIDDLLQWSDQRATVDRDAVARFEAIVDGAPTPPASQHRIAEIEAAPPVLSDAELAAWE